MTTEQSPVFARRIPVEAWNAGCRLAAVEPSAAEAGDLAQAGAAGLLGANGALDPRWRELIGGYLGAEATIQTSAAYAGLLYRATTALGTTNVCVLERFKTEPVDGALQPVAREDLLEVAATAAHPWLLLRRVLPPLAPLHAPAHQTGASSASPVGLDPATADRLRAVLAENPGADAADLLRREAPAEVRELIGEDNATVGYLLRASHDGRDRMAAGWYIASPSRLFRATFAENPGWVEVNPGDLAFELDYQLLGVRTLLGQN